MGHSDQPDDPTGALPPPPRRVRRAPSRAPEVPTGAPSLDLLEGFERATEPAAQRASGAAPLDPTAFGASSGPTPPTDKTLRIDLNAPAEPPLRPDPLTGLSIDIVVDEDAADAPDETVSSDALDVPDVAQAFDASFDALTSPPTPLEMPRDSAIYGLPLPAPLPVGVSTRDVPAHPAPLPVGVSTRDVSPPPDEPLTIDLPCAVLIVDPDRRAGAQTAARLMENGYTCRVADLASVATVLEQQAFDVALVDVPADEMAADGGILYLSTLASFMGPIVVSTDGPFTATDIVGLGSGVRGTLSKPYAPEDLIRGLEQARRAAERPAEIRPSGIADPTEPTEAPVRRPPAEPPGPADTPYDLPDGVRFMVIRGDGRTLRGVARSATYGGVLRVQMHEAPADGARLDVEVILMDGRRSEMPAVLHEAGDGLTLALDLDPGDAVHFGRFLDEARDPSLPPAEPLRMRERASAATTATSDDLQALWLAAQSRIQDDKAQQAFIQACLRQQQMDFAIRSYRQLKEENPDEELPAKYLMQVGTIVGFYALRKDAAGEDEGPGMSFSLKVALGLFVGAAFLLTALTIFLR